MTSLDSAPSFRVGGRTILEWEVLQSAIKHGVSELYYRGLRKPKEIAVTSGFNFSHSSLYSVSVCAHEHVCLLS